METRNLFDVPASRPGCPITDRETVSVLLLYMLMVITPLKNQIHCPCMSPGMLGCYMLMKIMLLCLEATI